MLPAHHALGIDISGQRFGRLMAIAPTSEFVSRVRIWYCQCDCGNECFVPERNMTKRGTRSCGCLKREATIKRNYRHGQSKTKRYSALKSARRRAMRVGGVGIHVVSPLEWMKKVNCFGRVCAYCGSPYEQADHVIPLARGGKDEISNLVPSCARCNRSKGRKMLNEWAPSKDEAPFELPSRGYRD